MPTEDSVAIGIAPVDLEAAGKRPIEEKLGLRTDSLRFVPTLGYKDSLSLVQVKGKEFPEAGLDTNLGRIKFRTVVSSQTGEQFQTAVQVVEDIKSVKMLCQVQKGSEASARWSSNLLDAQAAGVVRLTTTKVDGDDELKNPLIIVRCEKADGASSDFWLRSSLKDGKVDLTVYEGGLTDRWKLLLGEIDEAKELHDPDLYVERLDNLLMLVADYFGEEAGRTIADHESTLRSWASDVRVIVERNKGPLAGPDPFSTLSNTYDNHGVHDGSKSAKFPYSQVAARSEHTAHGVCAQVAQLGLGEYFRVKVVGGVEDSVYGGESSPYQIKTEVRSFAQEKKSKGDLRE